MLVPPPAGLATLDPSLEIYCTLTRKYLDIGTTLTFQRLSLIPKNEKRLLTTLMFYAIKLVQNELCT